MGVGVATGHATCGPIGFEGRYEYTAIGTVVNIASRFCAVADNGQVLVAQRVARALEDDLHTVELEPLSLKGIARPVNVFNVIPR